MSYEYRTTPFDHQRRAFERQRDERTWALLWEPRTGKSKVVIDTAAYNAELHRINAVFTVAPGGAADNWHHREIPTHCPERVDPRTFLWETRKASTKMHQRMFERVLTHEGLAFLNMSFEGLTTDRGANAAKEFLTKRQCLYDVDEAHRIKTWGTNRTSYVLASSKYAVMKRILTGTPIANCPFDIYTQFLFLDPNFWRARGFSTLTAFKAHHAIWEPREKYTGRYDAAGNPIKQRFNVVAEDKDGNKQYLHLDDLGKMLEEISDRILFADVSDMPPDVYERRYFEMTPEQWRIYRELRDEFITFLDSGEMVTADMAIVRLLRLQQVTCGYLPSGLEEDIQLLGEKNPRLECLMDYLEDVPHQAVIWARFQKDIDLICARLERDGEACVRYDGKVGKEERRTAVDSFQAGKVKWFVANPAAAGESLPLYAANTLVYYSNSFKSLERIQSKDRARHVDKKERVGIIDLTCAGTVDDRIADVLAQNQVIADFVTRDRLRKLIA